MVVATIWLTPNSVTARRTRARGPSIAYPCPQALARSRYPSEATVISPGGASGQCTIAAAAGVTGRSPNQPGKAPLLRA
jgi:hypothetical protein